MRNCHFRPSKQPPLGATCLHISHEVAPPYLGGRGGGLGGVGGGREGVGREGRGGG